MKTEKLIRAYIMKVVKAASFTWTVQIMTNTIWGFEGAPYKNFIRAKNKVKLVVKEMVAEGIIDIDLDGDNVPIMIKGDNFK